MTSFLVASRLDSFPHVLIGCYLTPSLQWLPQASFSSGFSTGKIISHQSTRNNVQFSAKATPSMAPSLCKLCIKVTRRLLTGCRLLGPQNPRNPDAANSVHSIHRVRHAFHSTSYCLLLLIVLRRLVLRSLSQGKRIKAREVLRHLRRRVFPSRRSSPDKDNPRKNWRQTVIYFQLSDFRSMRRWRLLPNRRLLRHS
jgi:hypothetical protein